VRVGLVATNRNDYDHPITPIGPLHLAAGLRARGHEVRLFDCMFDHASAEESLLAWVAAARPDAVGISIRNVASVLGQREHDLDRLAGLVKRLRAVMPRQIILGGAGFSLVPRAIMDRLQVDLGIVGEADRSLPSLLERLGDEAAYAGIPGLVHRTPAGGWIENPPDQDVDLDFIPTQSLADLDNRRYRKRGGNIGVYSRKGCAMQCTYCAEPCLNGATMRLRSPRLVVDEIEKVTKEAGYPFVGFADTLFNFPRDHAMELCREIIRRRVKVRFCIEGNPVGQDARSVDLLAEAGCIGVDFSVESGSSRMLRAMRKGFTAEDALRVAALYAERGISYAAGFLIGCPGEDLESVRESVRVAEALERPGVVYFGVGVRVFHQAELARQLGASRPHQGTPDAYGLSSYLSETFDANCARELLACYRRHDVVLISHQFNERTVRFVKRLSFLPRARPAWRAAAWLNHLERLRTLRRCPLYWDDRERAFRSV